MDSRPLMIDVLQIHPADNVCVAVRPLPAGKSVLCAKAWFVLKESVPLGAKLALVPLKAGDKVIKYGEPIGSLTADVATGCYIHTHNLTSDYFPRLP